MCIWMPPAVPEVEDQNRHRDFWVETLAFELRHDAFGWWSKFDDHRGNGSRAVCATPGPQRME